MRSLRCSALPTAPAALLGRPRLRARALTFGVVVAAALPLAVQQAGALTPAATTAQVEAQVEALQERAEQASEQYDASTIALADAQQAVAAANAKVATDQAALTAQRRTISSIVAAAYRHAGIDGTAALILGASPSDLLDRATALDRLSARDADRVRALRVAGLALQQAQTAAGQRVAEEKAVTARLAAQKQQVTELLGQAQQLLSTLKAQDRARIAAQQAAAQRAAEARALAATRATRSVAPRAVTFAGGSRVAAAIDFAMAQRGKPYVWGASGPDSYDCSGLTMMAYRAAGISLGHFTGAQWEAGRHVGRDELVPGDLVFFYGDHHHVGLYIGGGSMVEAPHTGASVRVASIDGRDFTGAVRLVG